MTREEITAMFIQERMVPIVLLDGRPGLCLQANDDGVLLDAWSLDLPGDNATGAEQMRLSYASLVRHGNALLQISTDGGDVPKEWIDAILAVHALRSMAVAITSKAPTMEVTDFVGLQSTRLAFLGLGELLLGCADWIQGVLDRHAVIAARASETPDEPA